MDQSLPPDVFPYTAARMVHQQNLILFQRIYTVRVSHNHPFPTCHVTMLIISFSFIQAFFFPSSHDGMLCLGVYQLALIRGLTALSEIQHYKRETKTKWHHG